MTYTSVPVNQEPDQPTLVSPADGAAGVSLSPVLSVTPTDPNADPIDVTFYGRPDGGSSGNDFTLIAIPDTQNKSTSYPSVMYNQFQWVADQYTAGTDNLVFVTNLGDIVNTASSTTQWVVADTAYDYLDAAGVPYSVSPGNHDLGGFYSTYFGTHSV